MGEGRGSRIRAHSFQFYSTRSRPFHTGERKNPRDGERVSSFPGLKARPLELPAFQPVSQLHGPRFQKCIRMRRPCVYNLPTTRPDQLSVQRWTELFGCAPPLVRRLLQEHHRLEFPSKYATSRPNTDQPGSVSKTATVFSTGKSG